MPRRSATRPTRALALAAALVAVGACSGTATEDPFVATLLDAERAGEDTPLLSEAEPGASLERAYDVQRAFVTARFGQGKIGGYKAGLSTASVRARFGADAPVAGVLPALGLLEGVNQIDTSGFRRLWVEIEFAFELGEDVSSPLLDTAALREVVAALRPAVELPNVGFAGLEGLRVVDLVAANVASSHLLLGAPVDPGTVDLGAVHASLSRGDETLIRFRGDESELDAWESIRWLVNDRLARGWPVRRGQILIAGSLGSPTDGLPGDYEADFGALGTLRFELTRTP